MKRKTGICIFAVALVVLLLWAAVLYRRSALLEEEPTEQERVAQEETTVAASAVTQPVYAYLARGQDGALVVYLGDGETVYMETGIRLSQLPGDLQTKLEGGIGFTDAESLFEFLENYAS